VNIRAVDNVDNFVHKVKLSKISCG